jgi:UDP-N-acetylmuramoylalanine--D-glutamate ligase
MKRGQQEYKLNGRTAVVGAGLSGQWAARLILAKGGGEVVFADQKEPEELAQVRAGFDEARVTWRLGAEAERAFKGVNLIVLSPGVPWTFPGLQAALARGATATGELELAASLVTVPLAAVTGSNGKTTTVGLLRHICRKLKYPVFVGGNFGDPLSRFVLEAPEVRAAVVEVSSYQLETARRFHAAAAAILNVTPDHLDRHADMAEYFRAKTNILLNQSPADLAVMNEDDLLLSLKNVTARRFGFSRRKAPPCGAWLRRDEIVVGEGGRAAFGRPWSDFKLEGVHNQENVMAAVGLALGLGLDGPKALEAAAGFTPERHRLELVGEFAQVRYYDDSKGTNVGAAARALESFKAPVVLIAGGQGKGQDFRCLYQAVRGKVSQLILIGEDRARLQKALTGAAPICLAEDMAEAVRRAKAAAARGSVVLLSPACASYDMFRDYRHRGETFAREVRRQNR